MHIMGTILKCLRQIIYLMYVTLKVVIAHLIELWVCSLRYYTHGDNNTDLLKLDVAKTRVYTSIYTQSLRRDKFCMFLSLIRCYSFMLYI